MLSLRWLFAELFLYLAHIQFWTLGNPCKILKSVQLNLNMIINSIKLVGLDAEHDDVRPTTRFMRKGQNQEEENYFNRVIEKEYETIYRPCDKKTDLYILQQNVFSKNGQIPSLVKSNCARYGYSG